MSSFIKISTLEYPRHEGDIRLEYPHILETQTGDTFPCPEDYAKIVETDKPSYNYHEQKCVEQLPQNVDGVWKQVWQIVNLTDEEKLQLDQTNSNTFDDVAGEEPSVIE